jgi:hypothetical protein
MSYQPGSAVVLYASGAIHGSFQFVYISSCLPEYEAVISFLLECAVLLIVWKFCFCVVTVPGFNSECNHLDCLAFYFILLMTLQYSGVASNAHLTYENSSIRARKKINKTIKGKAIPVTGREGP